MSSVIVIHNGSSIGDWATVASAAAAAVAAIASWRSVALVRAGLLPELHGYALGEDGRITVTIRNNGGGIAKATHVMLVMGQDGIVGPVGDGFLRPGEGFHVGTSIVSPQREASVVLFCRDANEVLRSWSSYGERKVYKSRLLRRKSYPDNNVIFNDLYPAIDLHRVREHVYQVEKV